ncbi:putative nuclease HARBI1 [Anoplophora glabripennis]|uniref:putative nuclease HARBI1 n=1 Tax=Anoplophora glabripennis TaxID=217634 RepID=UPI0008735AD0|nr:putative nuclease HARBI1 [Anoplophora glabripennis]
MALWYLGTPDSYRSVCGRFDLGKATGLRATRRIVKALFELGPTFIKWPNGEYANEIKEEFLRQDFPDTIGCIDGCHISIPLPKEHGQSYINRKGFSSLVLQVVCDHKLKFTHVYAGEPGPSHDARIFKNSDLYQKMMNDPQEMWIIHQKIAIW